MLQITTKICHLKQLYVALSPYPPSTSKHFSSVHLGDLKAGRAQCLASWLFKEKFGQQNAESLGDTLQWLHYVQFFLKRMFLRFSSKLVIFLLYQISWYLLGRKFSWYISICMAYFFVLWKKSTEEEKKFAPKSQWQLQSWGEIPILTPLTPCHFTTKEKHSQQADRWMTNLHSDLASTTWTKAAFYSQ